MIRDLGIAACLTFGLWLCGRFDAWSQRLEASSSEALAREHRRQMVRSMTDQQLGAEPAAVEAERVVQGCCESLRAAVMIVALEERRIRGLYP